MTFKIKLESTAKTVARFAQGSTDAMERHRLLALVQALEAEARMQGKKVA